MREKVGEYLLDRVSLFLATICNGAEATNRDLTVAMFNHFRGWESASFAFPRRGKSG
jgi:hypothetical protein